jgi:hypothetical protein
MKKEKSKTPPIEIVNAVKTIEKWAKKQTKRDDWAIGEIACRKGFERVLKMYNDLKPQSETEA